MSSVYPYKGYKIVSCVVDSLVVPARVSVKVWKIASDPTHTVPVYTTTSLDLAMRWIDAVDAMLKKPVAPSVERRMLPSWM